MNLEDALSRLLDDSDFIAIEESRRRFNIFDAIGGQRAEIRHSNFLKFLLSPDENHSLGSLFLRGFLRCALDKTPHNNRAVSTLQVVVADLDEAVVYREVDYIDVLIVIKELNLVVVIENKVGAKAAKGQLAGYKDVVARKYPHYQKLLIFLTPGGAQPDEPDYIPMNYSELAQLVDELRRDGHALATDVAVALDHYTRMLRRHVVDDEKLKELAIRIYEKHSLAFDFVFKNRPQGTSLLPVARSLAQNIPDIVEDRHNDGLFRFAMSNWQNIPALNSCAAKEWTKTGRNLLFEIKVSKKDGVYKDRVLLSLILGPSEPALRKALFDGVHARRDVFKSPSKTINDSYATIFSRELLAEAQASDMDDEEKNATIERNWNDFAYNQLPSIVTAMTEIGRTLSSKSSQ
ncbi:MAG: PD-(D/E)XK nuclease family protein [Pseudolabrys sp.]|nr:PD-(D/E)XK nuclease family protein [Pseudolabrys sp.]